jgi:hypothetical protein
MHAKAHKGTLHTTAIRRNTGAVLRSQHDVTLQHSATLKQRESAEPCRFSQTLRNWKPKAESREPSGAGLRTQPVTWRTHGVSSPFALATPLNYCSYVVDSTTKSRHKCLVGQMACGLFTHVRPASKLGFLQFRA